MDSMWLRLSLKRAWGMQLPIDGNPNREFGVLGNPGGLTDSAAGQSKIVTCGPGLISAWRVDEVALDKHRIRGGLGMAPFYALLDEAEFKLLQDVFYFCQLETEGIETETERAVSRSISIDKVKDRVRQAVSPKFFRYLFSKRNYFI